MVKGTTEEFCKKGKKQMIRIKKFYFPVNLSKINSYKSMLCSGNVIKTPFINLGPKVSPSVPEARCVNS